MAYRIILSNGEGQATYENCHNPRIKNELLSFWCETDLEGLISTYEFYIGNHGFSVFVEKESESE